MLILYHGSHVEVNAPKILTAGRLLDFGVGFYTTSSMEQAQRWAKIKMRREGKHVGYVSVYEFDDKAARKNLRIKTYAQANGEWLRFVSQNRTGTPQGDAYDIYIGPVADDNVYATVRLFEARVLTEQETVKRLKTERLLDQIAFHTQRSLAHLHFTQAREILEEAGYGQETV